MDMIIGCESSGAVRRAMRELGHNAWSCDITPADDDSPFHIQGDVLEHLNDGWQLGIFHPPCTYLANSGAKHLYKLDARGHTVLDNYGHRIPNPLRWRDLVEAAEFFRALWEAPIPRVAIENPVMHPAGKEVIGRGVPLQQTQTIQPYHFGHLEQKQTCLWLRGLPPLVATEDVKAATLALPYRERARMHSMGPSKDRQKLRSITYPGIARAMADQWAGNLAEAVA